MSFIIHFCILFFLFLINSLGPGFHIARRLRLIPLETLCVSASFSFFVIYLASFAIYYFNLPPFFYFVVSGISLIATLKGLKGLRHIMFHSEVIAPVLCFFVLLAWGLGFLALVRHYSGALWSGDWMEHYERSLFFLNHMPLDTRFLDRWILPSRPPLMNLVAGFYMGQIGQHFYIFQIAFFLLNLTVFFPCCLIARLMIRKTRLWIILLTSLFMFNPMFLQNVTFTWTKVFAAFYIILGVYFYIRFLRCHHSTHLILGFINVSIGFLVHFSAGPYALFLILHYIAFVFWNRKKRWRELVLCGASSIIILSSWFSWSIVQFGMKDTFLSTSATTGFSHISISENIIKIGKNIVNTIIVHPLRDVNLTPIKQASFIGYLRDYLFWIYQTNLIVAMGTTGSLVIIYLLLDTLRRNTLVSKERFFWILFSTFCTVVGIAVHGQFDQYGLAHICLQPIVILALVFLSVKLWDCSKFLKFFALIGFLLDYLFGILLHFSLQNRIFPIERTDSGQILISMHEALNLNAVLNYYAKKSRNLTFWGDFFAPISIPLQVSLTACACLILIYLGMKFRSEQKELPLYSIVP